MPINGSVIKEGATYAPTGGSDITFTNTGERIANGIVAVNKAETTFTAREKLICVSRPPVLGSDGRYSKQKQSLRISRPLVLSDGSVVYNVARVEIEVHPLSASGEGTNLLSLVSGCINDSDFIDFWSVGSLI